MDSLGGGGETTWAANPVHWSPSSNHETCVHDATSNHHRVNSPKSACKALPVAWMSIFLPHVEFIQNTQGGKRGDYQNCSVLYCVLELCTVVSTLRWAVLNQSSLMKENLSQEMEFLQFSGLGFVSLGPFVFMFVCFCLSCHYVLYYCNTVGWTRWYWSLILEHLPSVLWHWYDL